MLKFRNSGIALALALMLSITMLGSGAMAQSVTHDNTNATTAVTTTHQATTPSISLQGIYQTNHNGARHASRWVEKCGWHGWGFRREWKCYRYWRF